MSHAITVAKSSNLLAASETVRLQHDAIPPDRLRPRMPQFLRKRGVVEVCSGKHHADVGIVHDGRGWADAGRWDCVKSGFIFPILSYTLAVTCPLINRRPPTQERGAARQHNSLCARLYTDAGAIVPRPRRCTARTIQANRRFFNQLLWANWFAGNGDAYEWTLRTGILIHFRSCSFTIRSSAASGRQSAKRTAAFGA